MKLGVSRGEKALRTQTLIQPAFGILFFTFLCQWKIEDFPFPIITVSCYSMETWSFIHKLYLGGSERRSCDLKCDWSVNYTEKPEELHFKCRSRLIPLYYDSSGWTTLYLQYFRWVQVFLSKSSCLSILLFLRPIWTWGKWAGGSPNSQAYSLKSKNCSLWVWETLIPPP